MKTNKSIKTADLLSEVIGTSSNLSIASSLKELSLTITELEQTLDKLEIFKLALEKLLVDLKGPRAEAKVLNKILGNIKENQNQIIREHEKLIEFVESNTKYIALVEKNSTIRDDGDIDE